MRNPFRSPFKVTQNFGVNADYYKKFGLAAHEGLDLVPTSADWVVLALEDGIVVKDEDNPRSGAYGVNVTLWHKGIKKATQYCHLKNNTVTLNQQVKKGDQIGTMGSTGNSSGSHLHLNLFDVDDNGVRLNRNNGYLGGIDPLPFLQDSSQDTNEIDKVRKERDANWNLYQQEKQTSQNLNESLIQKNAELATANNLISSLQAQLSEADKTIKSLSNQAKKVPDLKEERDQAEWDRDIILKAETTYKKRITDLTKEVEELKKNAPKAFGIWLLETITKKWK